MLKESRSYVQGGIIADRTRICDVCGADIPQNAVGWAYVQETKTPTQARLMSEQGGRDEFEHVCLKCWEEIKHDHLRPKRDGEETDVRRKEEDGADQRRDGKVQGTMRREPEKRRDVPHKDRDTNGRR